MLDIKCLQNLHDSYKAEHVIQALQSKEYWFINTLHLSRFDAVTGVSSKYVCIFGVWPIRGNRNKLLTHSDR